MIEEYTAFEVIFLDTVKKRVYDLNFSRAIVQAQYQRYLEGAATHKELSVMSIATNLMRILNLGKEVIFEDAEAISKETSMKFRVVKERWYHRFFDFIARHTGRRFLKVGGLKGITCDLWVNKSGKVYIGK